MFDLLECSGSKMFILFLGVGLTHT